MIPETKEVCGQVFRKPKEHYGDVYEFQRSSRGDMEDIKMYLVRKGLAPITIHRRLQFARMFFRAAKRRKLIVVNPFAEVSAKSAIRSDRQYFIDRDETERVIKVCNPTWRVIVALARYGGLRCPSAVLSLRWQDVDWDAERIVVQSPKTLQHPGMDSRTIPLFSELKPFLTEAFELAPDGTEYVVESEYREAADTPSGR